VSASSVRTIAVEHWLRGLQRADGTPLTQMLRQGDAQVFKKYSQMKLQMKREALEKLNRRANEIAPGAADVLLTAPMCTVALQ
jgi:hypothetical protein